MRILVFPRDGSNPYQGLLYGELERRGVTVTYLGRLTPSCTLNLLLLPWELAARRAGGARLVHLHWVFGFALPGSRRFPVLRRLAQAWFTVWLTAIRMLGMRLVWTAYNLLPHTPVFADAARRALINASDLVLAHSPAALGALRSFGVTPRRSAVIRHGPLGPAGPAGPLPRPGSAAGPRRFLFVGRVREYKGVDDLLTAFLALPEEIPAQLTVAGHCDDPKLAARLAALAHGARRPVVLRLAHVPDAELTRLLAAADAVVLPYRRVTTSGSAMLALGHGRPLITSTAAAPAGLPEQAVIRYDGTVPALTSALGQVARADAAALAAMSVAARRYSAGLGWPEIAGQTFSEITGMLACSPQPGSPTLPTHTPAA